MEAGDAQGVQQAPPFEGPPQIAYGYWAERPAPRGPYLWPCLPQGYDLAPPIAVQLPATQGQPELTQFQQPPQVAYGWFIPMPPPSGPYFWSCLPPGYGLVRLRDRVQTAAETTMDGQRHASLQSGLQAVHPPKHNHAPANLAQQPLQHATQTMQQAAYHPKDTLGQHSLQSPPPLSSLSSGGHSLVGLATVSSLQDSSAHTFNASLPLTQHQPNLPSSSLSASSSSSSPLPNPTSSSPPALLSPNLASPRLRLQSPHMQPNPQPNTGIQPNLTPHAGIQSTLQPNLTPHTGIQSTLQPNLQSNLLYSQTGQTPSVHTLQTNDTLQAIQALSSLRPHSTATWPQPNR